MRFRDTDLPSRTRVGSTSSTLAVVFLFFGVAFIDALLARNWSFALLFASLCFLAFSGAGIRPDRR